MEGIAVQAMPNFATGTQAHIHSLHSALTTLAALGVGAQRITVRRSGREGVDSGTVVSQSPGPGEPLHRDTPVLLHVAGLGFTHALPVGMWDSGGEAYAGTREILQGFDDPLEKLKHWFHEGAPLFRIAADDPAACARWLQLFGIEPEQWPRPLWYPLATLAARLAHLSCSEEGCALVLRTMLGLPVKSFRHLPATANVPQAMLSFLGRGSSRLGVDLIAGDTVEDIASLEIVVGPVALATYEQFRETPDGSALMRRVLELVMPASTTYAVAWEVLDRTRPPQLGIPEGNSRLGINTHMGRGLGMLFAANDAGNPGNPAGNRSETIAGALQ